MNNVWHDLGIDFTQPVRDPLWLNILLPREFSELIGSAEFVKLGRIMQLGPTHLIYPGATHTRRAHSFGVYDLAKRILNALSERYRFPWLDGCAARSFLIAALCHDLGHFPYAHSLKELPLTEHETLSAQALRGPLASAVRSAGGDPELAAAIVDESSRGDHPGLGLFRSLLSGVLDPDKLDYLNRDAWACGVPYGTQDVDYILQHIGLTDSGRLAIDQRGVMSVEAVLFSKYQMYRAVYWHRGVRAATAMIKQALVADVRAGRVVLEDLYGLDDAGFYALMSMEGRDPLRQITAVLDGRLFQMVYEASFDAGKPMHAALLDLEQRPRLEAELAARFKAAGYQERLVIDIPEPISFESQLPVLDTHASFTEVSTAFGLDLVRSFERSLRLIRVFAPETDQGLHTLVQSFMDQG